MAIDDILSFNSRFVEEKGYEPYITDKFPKKELAILTCMDTRLSVLLQEALGLKNGDAKIIKNAGAVIPTPYDSAMRSLVVAVYELGVKEVMVIAHSTCGACHMSYHHLKEEMLKRGIPSQTLSGLEKDGIDLDSWLEGFHDTEKSVRDTVSTIKNHPLMPEDLIVRGFIMDSVTGGLTEVECI
jgi:carbonic anhydrase